MMRLKRKMLEKVQIGFSVGYQADLLQGFPGAKEIGTPTRSLTRQLGLT